MCTYLGLFLHFRWLCVVGCQGLLSGERAVVWEDFTNEWCGELAAENEKLTIIKRGYDSEF